MNRTTESQRTVRRLRVLDLRVAGATHRQILATLQTEAEPYMRLKSVASVKNDEDRILAEMREDSRDAADRHRAIVNERYESLFLRWYPVAIGATEDSMRASEHCRRLLADMRGLWGLDPDGPLVQINQTSIVENTMIVQNSKDSLREKLQRVIDAGSRNGDGTPAKEELPDAWNSARNGHNATNGNHPAG